METLERLSHLLLLGYFGCGFVAMIGVGIGTILIGTSFRFGWPFKIRWFV